MVKFFPRAIIGILVLTVVFWIVGSNRFWQPRQSLGQPAPAFALQDFRGKTVRLQDFQGKPLVINSWAAWCPFCVQELKDFADVQDEFKGRVVIIAINRAEPISTAKKFADDLGVRERLIFLQDPADSFYRSLGGLAMPETIFVDGSGAIRDHKRGSMAAAEIRERISTLLR